METTLRRREILASTPIFLSTLAGCALLQNGSRLLQTMVINHTDESIEVELLVVHNSEDIIEQRFSLHSQNQVKYRPSSVTRVRLDDLSKESELKATIIVDGDRKETTKFSINCGKDAEGDNIGFRVYEEYIDPKGGCAADRNITDI